MGKERKLLRTVFGDETTAERFPWMNKAMLLYSGAVMICFVLFLIAPFVTFISKTPLDHIQAYLGLLGAGLLCLDVVTSKVLWRGNYCVLLYGLCALAAVASVRTISYGVRDNLFLLCWTAIQFAIFYTLPKRTSGETLRKFAAWVFGILAVIWMVAVLISLWQYVIQKGYRYVVDPTADDSSTARQGFIEHRLFGIFNPLNHAAMVSVMLLLTGLYYIVKNRRVWVRVLLGVCCLAWLSHILLSGSRNAQVCLMVCAAATGFLVARNRTSSWKGFRQAVVVLTSAVLAAVLTLGCFVGMKSALAQVPRAWEAHHLSAGQQLQNGQQNPQNLPVIGEAETQTMLDRPELEDNLSNDRFTIWTDYMSLHRQIGLVGLSPGNYMGYVAEHAPDLYIVRYVRDEFPGKFSGGLICHVHNGYLMTFVSTGWLGVALMAAFIILSVIRLVKYLIRSKRVSAEFILALVLVLVGAISAVFDKAVFFMNNAHTFIFWLALGVVNHLPLPEQE